MHYVTFVYTSAKNRGSSAQVCLFSHSTAATYTRSRRTEGKGAYVTNTRQASQQRKSRERSVESSLEIITPTYEVDLRQASIVT